ncbi:ryncolin-1-like [Ostrea edulis]|uniref:ryncolin-1-like n=1 Tax=Ostrea edulis TaxID=37623 RepID=UPI0020946830|nr:ryncolin-1-like [Ostrea edulis]XP_056013921.1 ryncolin-1-like [Ostrea edulis]
MKMMFGTVGVCVVLLAVCCNGYEIDSNIRARLNNCKLLKSDESLWRLLNVKYVKPVGVLFDVLSTYEWRGCDSCADILKADPSRKGHDGIYTIYSKSNMRKNVFCDMTTEGGGWTVIQKRIDGSTDFYRTWKEYKNGFGDPSKNYWIGNEFIHLLTNGKTQQLRIDLQRFTGEKGYAKYSKFIVGDENSKYKLMTSGYSGTARDGLKYHNGMKFTTKDQDNDAHGGNYNCAKAWHGAWWYRKCHQSNLNGLYTTSAVVNPKHPTWYPWKRRHEALKSTLMMIRPR